MEQQHTISLDKTVYALCTEDPQIAEILALAGFTDITKPGMLTTAGRFMTIRKGAALKKLDIQSIAKVFAAHGYQVKDTE